MSPLKCRDVNTRLSNRLTTFYSAAPHHRCSLTKRAGRAPGHTMPLTAAQPRSARLCNSQLRLLVAQHSRDAPHGSQSAPRNRSPPPPRRRPATQRRSAVDLVRSGLRAPHACDLARFLAYRAGSPLMNWRMPSMTLAPSEKNTSLCPARSSQSARFGCAAVANSRSPMTNGTSSSRRP